MKKTYCTPQLKAIAFSGESLLAASTVNVYDAAADKNKEVLSNHRGIFDDPWDDNQEW